ncbi:Odorant receptor [Operophtera brumata]|uniref:Odorant receptor n=1 Tax=Operophtera brumata TaxID=104452 RepID=A0A0L7LUX5_OPEBR|nr:Odorant receptor [Operophtera brumata]
MISMDWAKNYVREVKYRLVETNFDNLMWLVNIVPNLAGFSVRNDKIHGCAVYQVKYATGAEDFIKSYVNVSLLILIGNISWWWLMKRKKHTRHLRIIKIIIMAFYASQLFDGFFIYMPHRVDICLIILAAQELSIMTCVLNYQTMLVFLIAHTAAMFHMLTREMMALNSYSDLEEHKVYVSERLPALIRRHALTLEVFNNLKLLYSVPIGVDFGSNAVCISLFFYIAFQEWLKFVPVFVYCFSVFFMYCFLCQSMTNASEKFETAVYSCGWENFGLKEKKLVYVMLLRAQKPVVLLAADIIPVNMYTFATTLQFMFKFVTVVKF